MSCSVNEKHMSVEVCPWWIFNPTEQYKRNQGNVFSLFYTLSPYVSNDHDIVCRFIKLQQIWSTGIRYNASVLCLQSGSTIKLSQKSLKYIVTNGKLMKNTRFRTRPLKHMHKIKDTVRLWRLALSRSHYTITFDPLWLRNYIPDGLSQKTYIYHASFEESDGDYFQTPISQNVDIVESCRQWKIKAPYYTNKLTCSQQTSKMNTITIRH